VDEKQDDKRAAYELRRAEMMRLVERRLRSDAGASALADDACVSRFHFQRVFRHLLGEAPGKLERRLRLERAANTLLSTKADVMTVALDAGYASIEGFSRAFRRAYGESPRDFRKQRGTIVDLHGASHVHFDARTLSLRMMNKGGKGMDLVDRMLDNDYRAKRALLEASLKLSEAQLDAPLLTRIRIEPWLEPDSSLRQMLTRLTDMGWVAELLKTVGWPHSGEGWLINGDVFQTTSVGQMIEQLDGFYRDYLPFVNHVKENDLWETTWVDAACEPAETFSYATVIEYCLQRSMLRAFIAQGLLAQVGTVA
jgi:AraC family transcriptional regulator